MNSKYQTISCFLFWEQLQDNSGLSLCLNYQEEIIAPLIQRDFDEIRLLQTGKKTTLVLPARMVSLHLAELPRLSENRARIAIPYALEDQVAQPVNALHFAFDTRHYADGCYLVTVIDRQTMLDVVTRMHTLNLHYDSITVDWFALQAHEACITATDLLVNTPGFKGSLGAMLASDCIEEVLTDCTIHTFSDSLMSLRKQANKRGNTAPSPALVPMLPKATAAEWIAQRLISTNPVNLCQGDLVRGQTQNSKRWYQASVLLAGLWLCTLVGFGMLKMYNLTHANTIADEQIAHIYREFFPDAKQVINPEFRIRHLLQSAGTTANQPLWHLLQQLGKTFDSKEFTIQQLRFQDQILHITLVSEDFAALENLQLRLQKDGMTVRQTQASSREQGVLANLELSE